MICPSGKITPAFKTFLSFCIHQNIRLGQSASAEALDDMLFSTGKLNVKLLGGTHETAG